MAVGQPSENLASGPLVQPVKWRLFCLSWEHKRVLSITQHPILLFLSFFPLRPHCSELEQMAKATIKGTKPTLPPFYCHASGERSSPLPPAATRITSKDICLVWEVGGGTVAGGRKNFLTHVFVVLLSVKPGSKLESEAAVSDKQRGQGWLAGTGSRER